MCCCHCQHFFYLFFILLLEPVATTSTALSANFRPCSYGLASLGSVITVTRRIAYLLVTTAAKLLHLSLTNTQVSWRPYGDSNPVHQVDSLV